MPKRFLSGAALLLALLCSGAAHSANFQPCDDAGTQPALAGSLCAREAAPLSHAAPGGEQLSLFIRKLPAHGPSKGTVWLIAGGPGESGASFYPFIERLRRSFPGYDLMAPDHRGTGLSSRLCPAEEAAGSPGGMALAGAEWSSCFAQLNAQPGRAREFTITNAAHDLRRLILRHRDGKPVYVYGVSYGTQLVLRALQIGELPVKGLVLDSLVPLETAERWDLSRRSLVTDDVGRQVLARCDADPRCAAVAQEAVEPLYRRVLAAHQPGKEGSLPRLMGRLLDVPEQRARIPHLLRDLDAGKGEELARVTAGLLDAGAALGGYPQSPPSIPLVGIISGSENNLRPGLSAAALKAEEDPLLFSSPLPGLLLQSGLPLYPRDAWFGGHPAWLPPTLVLHGTLDPKTHFEGAMEHVAALRQAGKVTLAEVADAPHFILWTAPGAFERQVRAFVAD
ncbi:alpha/beta fold hydrolase [Massilia sp. G4R7]|uniref:Alpha/beta fold hydrolase n=1 Tax=Massilia phyllostachyos TaxID=2898585 RepID=A0ABS8Q8L1_9BURK|nr:alpha/beta fold hydrolase [Massilia phyllostachyos]MCD2518082.1 alpha/beta fold hydrolase [Massilia phyllostachyos]